MSRWVFAVGAMNVWYNQELTDLTRIVKNSQRPKFQPVYLKPFRTVYMSDEDKVLYSTGIKEKLEKAAREAKEKKELEERNKKLAKEIEEGLAAVGGIDLVSSAPAPSTSGQGTSSNTLSVPTVSHSRGSNTVSPSSHHREQQPGPSNAPPQQEPSQPSAAPWALNHPPAAQNPNASSSAQVESGAPANSAASNNDNRTLFQRFSGPFVSAWKFFKGLFSSERPRTRTPSAHD